MGDIPRAFILIPLRPGYTFETSAQECTDASLAGFDQSRQSISASKPGSVVHCLVVENTGCTGWIVSRRKRPHSRVKSSSVRGKCEEKLFQSLTDPPRGVQGRCQYWASLENRVNDPSQCCTYQRPHDPISVGNWRLATSVGWGRVQRKVVSSNFSTRQAGANTYHCTHTRMFSVTF